MEDEKKEILKELIISEKDTIKKLRLLVEKSKKYIGINEKDGKIIIKNPNFSNRKKILLLLIGRYFSKELGLIKKDSLTLREISKELGTKVTTVSGPVGDLVKAGILKKENAEYRILHYRIEEVLNNFENEKENKKTVSKKIKTTKKTKMPKILPQEIKKLTPIKEGIKDLAEKVGVDEEDLYKIFDFDEKIHLLVQPKGKNEGEKQLKASLIILTAYNHYFNKREISSSDLIRMLEDVGIGSLVNLSTNLKEHRDLIIHKKGKRGSTKTSYRITIPGLHEGYLLIKELLKNKESENKEENLR